MSSEKSETQRDEELLSALQYEVLLLEERLEEEQAKLEAAQDACVGQSRLYGLPGAEVMHDDPAAVWETDIQPYCDVGGPWEIEEWSTYPPTHGIASADRILEWIGEAAYDETVEGWADRYAIVCADPEVLSAVESVRSLIGEKVGFLHLHADSPLRTMRVTLDGFGAPLLDGVPMYRRRDSGRSAVSLLSLLCSVSLLTGLIIEGVGW